MPANRWTRYALPTALVLLAVSGCAFDGPRSTLDPVAYVAREQMELFTFTFQLSLFVMAIVVGVLAYALIRYRHAGKKELPNQTHGSVPLEVTWTLIPVIIVVLIAVPTVRTIFETEQRVEPTSEDLIVNVRGYQWWWAFEYPEYGIVTANELHVPRGRRVVLNLTSMDVLHSFWVPKLAGKRDLIPNQDNQLWFTTDEDTPTGIYLGHCAELCLGAHAYMRMRVMVDEPQEFEGWVESFQDEGAQQVQASGTLDVGGVTGSVDEGRVLFGQKGCAGCHTIEGYYPGVTIGDPDFPNLTNFGQRTTIAAGVLENTPENLARWLRDPQEVKPTNYMPTLWSEDDPLREEQIADLVAYLLSLGADGEEQAQASVVGGN